MVSKALVGERTERVTLSLIRHQCHVILRRHEHEEGQRNSPVHKTTTLCVVQKTGEANYGYPLDVRSWDPYRGSSEHEVGFKSHS